MRTRWLLGAALLMTAALYWPGLHGPFLLDDFHNLLPLQQWLTGNASWQSVVLGNASGSLGRSLSMASFLLQAWLGGTEAFDFKLVNLILHLACGLLVWQVLRSLLALDRRLAVHAPLIASIVATLWLLHPLHVSTVLYAVQRMAQLSTLCVLAAVWTYLAACHHLRAGRMGPALLQLFVLFPLLLACGLLSKENAAVAPALCMVLEIAYFCRRPQSRLPLRLFFALFLLLPLLAVVGLLLFEPDRLLAGYASREFTLGERLLTQPRALFGYIGQLLLPRGPSMGVYTDGLVVSKGLFTPATTFWAILGIVVVSGFAVSVRKRAPSVFAGWFFFLGAHGVESSFLPLELAFEHRNYLPSVGLFLAVTGLCVLTQEARVIRETRLRQVALIAVVGFAIVLAFATLGRVLVWQHKETIVEQALKSHPGSLRANLDQATLYLEKKQFSKSIAVLTRMSHADDPRWRTVALVDMLTIDCLRGIRGDSARLAQAAANTQSIVTLAEADAWQKLTDTSIRIHCDAAPYTMLADAIMKALDKAASQPDMASPKSILRYNAAKLRIQIGRWHEAQAQAEIAWKASAEPAIGGLLVHIYIHNNLPVAASRTLAQVATLIKPYDREGQDKLSQLRESLARITPETTPARQ